MPYQSSTGTNDAFAQGQFHAVNPGRANTGSITLGDAGLDAASDRWAATTPHGVLASTIGASQDDSAWERLQRDAGGYAPGFMTKFQDQIDQGRNDNLH